MSAVGTVRDVPQGGVIVSTGPPASRGRNPYFKGWPRGFDPEVLLERRKIEEVSSRLEIDEQIQVA